MKIIFVKKKLEKIFNSADRLQREYGENADKIKIRMDVLMAADNLSQIPAQRPERRHELSGKRQGLFAVDLKQPFRLLFKPALQLLFQQKKMETSTLKRLNRS